MPVTGLLTVLPAAVLGVAAGAYVTALVPRALGDEPLLRPWPSLQRCLPRPGRALTRLPRADLAVLGVTALLFGALALRLGMSPVLPAYLYLGGVSVALAAIDMRTRRLPDALTLPSYPAGIGLLGVAAALAEQGLLHFTHALVGMVVLFFCYLLLFLIYPKGMGFGDVKLAGILGLYLGWFGAGVLLVGAFLGYLLGGLYGLVAIFAGRATRKTAIPFGPFMIGGALLGVLVGEQIAAAYATL